MGPQPWRAAAFAALLLTGCGVRRGPIPAPPPFWIDNEERPEGLGATGLAQANPQGDIASQRLQAVADAQARLTTKVKARARNLCARLRPRLMVTAADGSLQAVDPEVTRRFTDNLLKALGAKPLEGVATSAFWEDPLDHTLYVFAAISRASVATTLATAVRDQLQVLATHGGPSLTLAPGALEDALAATKP